MAAHGQLPGCHFEEIMPACGGREFQLTSTILLQAASAKRVSPITNFHLPEVTTLVTMQSNSVELLRCSAAFYEHRRDYSKLPLAKGNVAGRYRKAHWSSALLPLASGKWAHHPIARHACEDCHGHGVAIVAILLRHGSHQGIEGFAAPLRGRSPLPQPDPPLFHQPQRQRSQAGACDGEEDGVERGEVSYELRANPRFLHPIDRLKGVRSLARSPCLVARSSVFHYFRPLPFVSARHLPIPESRAYTGLS